MRAMTFQPFQIDDVMASASARRAKRKYTADVNERKIALVYVRVSTGKQAEGDSLDAQEATCRFHAERLGMAVDSVFREEGISGKEDATGRPALASLFQRVKELEGAGFRPVVVVKDLSRFSRSQLFILTCMKAGLMLSSATQAFDTSTAHGRAFVGMLAVWAELEAEGLSERTAHGLAYSRDVKGTQLGQRRVEQLVDPEVVLAIIHAMQVEKLSQRRTCERLEFLGLKTPKGSSKWNMDSLQRILAALKDGKFDLETGRAVG